MQLFVTHQNRVCVMNDTCSCSEGYTGEVHDKPIYMVILLKLSNRVLPPWVMGQGIRDKKQKTKTSCICQPNMQCLY